SSFPYGTGWPLMMSVLLESWTVSPGTATTRLTSRVPSLGESKTTISPRFGFDHSAMWIVVNGTFRSYASLFTKMRSPSMIVGFIEPVGTTFQSAIADRTEKSAISRTNSGRICSLQNLFHHCLEKRGSPGVCSTFGSLIQTIIGDRVESFTCGRGFDEESRQHHHRNTGQEP